MATKPHTSTSNLTAPLPASLAQAAPVSAAQAAPPVAPANRLFVFAKTCTNDHGTFAKGDKARGAFSAQLVASYVAAGILVPASQDAPTAAPTTTA